MTVRSRFEVVGSAVIASALVWAAPTATAAEQHGMSADVGSTSVISTPNRETATVPITVGCDPIADQVSGYVTVIPAQTLGSKTSTGTGSVDVVCDGLPHDYQAAVTATTDTPWRQAGATVSLIGQADGYGTPQQVCHSVMNPDGTITTICETWTPQLHLSAATDPMPIQLVAPH
jgi:hypothetical protein